MTARPVYSVTDARKNFKQILDEAQEGHAVRVHRGQDDSSALVDAVRLREHLAKTVPAKVDAVHEDGAWVLTMPGLPVAVEATLYEQAIAELVDALSEYAEDWHARLRDAPNHRPNWSLVQLVDLSSEEDLKRWVTGEIE